MMPKFFISVIMPALNEEKSIIPAIDNTLAALDGLKIDGEVIVVNDGSTDDTYELVEQKRLNDNRTRVITHQTPKGIGACFWDGVDNAKGDIVTMIPGDNENDAWETLRYVRLLEHVDIVIPFAYNKNVRPLARNILSFIYKSIINLTFMTNFNYTNSTIIYRKSILKQLKYRDSSFFYQTDILIRTSKKGYLFAEVPYRLGLRESGKSKAVSFLSLHQIVRGYFNLIKDIYFKKEITLEKHRFSDDSVSARRYRDSGDLNERADT